jgi:hypothetical protein
MRSTFDVTEFLGKPFGAFRDALASADAASLVYSGGGVEPGARHRSSVAIFSVVDAALSTRDLTTRPETRHESSTLS